MQAQSGVELTVLGSWSLPKEGQEGIESFLRDLSTIFPQERWLQIRRQMGKMGFTCEVLNRHQSKTSDWFPLLEAASEQNLVLLHQLFSFYFPLKLGVDENGEILPLCMFHTVSSSAA